MPLQMHLESHHHDQETRFQSFAVDRPGNIIFVGHHLSTSIQARCVIRTISQAGACLDVDAAVEIPNHFFLEILGLRDEIGCTLVKREGTEAKIGFNMLLNPEFLHHILRLEFEMNG